jgi:hypothetical protein
MVAYSFKSQFEGPIQRREKRQTVRTLRKRNPRVGERIQLYCGMRTKRCRKIIPDPVCTGWELVEIDVDAEHPLIISAVSLSGYYLSSLQIGRFAVHDGFGGPGGYDAARRRMGEFWLNEHGEGTFSGVVIRWEDA